MKNIYVPILTLFFSISLYSQQSIEITVGIDENLTSPGPKFEVTGFKKSLGWSDAQINEFYKKVEEYFTVRFGIDFTSSSYDESTHMTIGNSFIMLPVTFGNSYAVILSNSDELPANIAGVPSYIRVAEFVLAFNENATGKFYGGTYSPSETIPIDATDTLSFGCYQVFVADGRTFDIYMRSLYPNKVVKTENRASPVSVILQLHSEQFGEGTGFFTGTVSMTPNEENLFPTTLRGTWSFPLSYL